jgi:ribose-phosphate pyrophosphokinase
MIAIDGQVVQGYTPITFPDGTSSIRYQPDGDTFGFNIDWMYDNDGEHIVLWNLVNHIKEQYPSVAMSLYMPYIPHARMDRVKNPDEVFTLKWFSKFINTLGFCKVTVRDPHSGVSTALIDRVVCETAQRLVGEVMREMGTYNPPLCYPDEGAMKKYSEQFNLPYVFGIKKRDWRTGELKGLELQNADIVQGKIVLIVDDICSKGGTFVRTAKELMKAGATKVFLYVTHCENSIFDGELLSSTYNGQPLIERVFTTRSILRVGHERITFLNTPERAYFAEEASPHD